MDGIGVNQLTVTKPTPVIFRDTSPLSLAQVIEGRAWPAWEEIKQGGEPSHGEDKAVL